MMRNEYQNRVLSRTRSDMTNNINLLSLASLIVSLNCIVLLATADQPNSNSGSSSSMIMGTLMRYFDPATFSNAISEQPRMLANWSPTDESRKQQVLTELISKASNLIESYQTNGLRNAPSFPINIPGLGSVMKTPDKLLRAELSMLQDLIKMAQKMMQNPISATVDLPKDFAVLMSRTAFQIEQ